MQASEDVELALAARIGLAHAEHFDHVGGPQAPLDGALDVADCVGRIVVATPTKRLIEENHLVGVALEVGGIVLVLAGMRDMPERIVEPLIASEIARLERLRDSHFDDQLAIRRKISYSEKSLAGATQRIAEIAQDLARRTPTRERKAAGEALIALAKKLKSKKPGETALVGALGGFAIEARITTFDELELELKLGRASRSDPIACEKDVTPLGLVSRLELALSRFEVELAEERRTVAGVSGWMPGFKARLCDAFPHQAVLDEKRAEMAELEASLAATPAAVAPPEATEAAA